MTDENGETPVSRRDLFKAGVIGAGLAAYAGMGSEEAMAQSTSERLLNLGTDKLYQFDRDGNDNLIIRHKDNGEILKYDPVADEITTPRAIGSSTQPVPSITTESIDVTNFGQGYDAVIVQDASGNNIVIDGQSGAFLAGGSENKNVSDATDFADILEYVVDTAGNRVIKLGAHVYSLDNQVTLSSAQRNFHIYGAGRNRTYIDYTSGFPANGTGITIEDGGSGTGNIWGVDRVKFRAGNGNPDRHIHVKGRAAANECVFTHTEFRDANNWGVDFDASATKYTYNQFIGCWFLTGAGLRVRDFDDLRLIGNRFADTTTLEIRDSNDVIRSGNEFADVNLINTTLGPEPFDDPSGLTHHKRVADSYFGHTLNSLLSTTVGGGSVTFLHDRIEMREPGAGAASEESRIYDTAIGFDTDESHSIRLDLSNITVDANLNARIVFGIYGSPNNDGKNGADPFIHARIRGDDKRSIILHDGASESQNGPSGFGNISGVGSLEYAELSWDGSTATLDLSDGEFVESISHSTNYPSGSQLKFKAGAFDADGSNARNVDFDIDALSWD